MMNNNAFDENVEIIENTDVEIVKKCTDFEENQYVYFLRNYKTGEIVSPNVYKIEYEPNSAIFKVHDKIKINNDVTINSYFYLKSDGNILGLLYNDFSDGLSGLQLSDGDLVTAYEQYKEYIIEKINIELNTRINKHDENVRKFLNR